ncbi:glycoside hydrolase superfamily [Lactarius quietus]|nr:glycoside hydrolase superfamily [Lactarius quietus]
MQLLVLLFSTFALFRETFAGAAPDKIYGVNLGSWLLLEPWMLPVVRPPSSVVKMRAADLWHLLPEWVAMGGQTCNDCSTCIASEFAFVAAYPDTADEKFAEHWDTWFTTDDVNALKAAGINTVRWGLMWLRDAGMQVILDHHALPGVQTSGQMFTGNCTNNVQFYTDYNYGRALTWTSVMTFLSHLHPHFESVFAIEAVNEPIMNATQTPGYGDCKHVSTPEEFVEIVRATELLLGIVVPGVPALQPYNASSVSDLSNRLTDAPQCKRFSKRHPYCAAAIGPQSYDHHLYYRSDHGVAAANPDAYLKDICNRKVFQAEVAVNNIPMWKWADAQKQAYSPSAGWLFWNFKLEAGNPLEPQWSYLKGLSLGYFTQDPSQYNDPNVCAPYINFTSTTNNSRRGD